MELDKLKTRKTTIEQWPMRIGLAGLICAFSFALWVFHQDHVAQSVTVAFGINSILAFFGLMGAADSRRTANILGVEQIRPYLRVLVEDSIVSLENVGRGIALEVVLYTAGRKEVEKIGIMPPGTKRAVSPLTGKLIVDQGIEVFCTCQTTRWWNASIGPAASNFATSYSELECPPDQERAR